MLNATHKLHSPKGIGFLYVNHKIKIKPFIFGGAQERNMRGGTENVYGIVGLAKAMKIAYRDLKQTQEYILGLKNYMIQQHEKKQPSKQNNNDTKESTQNTVLNV